jgi:hypothetical protein
MVEVAHPARNAAASCSVEVGPVSGMVHAANELDGIRMRMIVRKNFISIDYKESLDTIATTT